MLHLYNDDQNLGGRKPCSAWGETYTHPQVANKPWHVGQLTEFKKKGGKMLNSLWTYKSQLSGFSFIYHELTGGTLFSFH